MSRLLTLLYICSYQQSSYIPIKPDYSDILDITAYFTGDLQGQNGHDAAAERIAANAREWSDKHDRMTDMSCYMF